MRVLVSDRWFAPLTGLGADAQRAVRLLERTGGDGVILLAEFDSGRNIPNSLDSVAQPGNCVLTLNNNEYVDSVDNLTYSDPFNPYRWTLDCLIGKQLRVYDTDSLNREALLWTGFIKDITPAIDRAGRKTAQLLAEGSLARLKKMGEEIFVLREDINPLIRSYNYSPADNAPISPNDAVAPGDLIWLLLVNVGWVDGTKYPRGTAADPSPLTIPARLEAHIDVGVSRLVPGLGESGVVGSSARRTDVLTALKEIAKSELGFLYETRSGVIRFNQRDTRRAFALNLIDPNFARVTIPESDIQSIKLSPMTGHIYNSFISNANQLGLALYPEVIIEEGDEISPYRFTVTYNSLAADTPQRVRDKLLRRTTLGEKNHIGVWRRDPLPLQIRNYITNINPHLLDTETIKYADQHWTISFTVSDDVLRSKSDRGISYVEWLGLLWSIQPTYDWEDDTADTEYEIFSTVADTRASSSTKVYPQKDLRIERDSRVPTRPIRFTYLEDGSLMVELELNFDDARSITAQTAVLGGFEDRLDGLGMSGRRSSSNKVRIHGLVGRAYHKSQVAGAVKIQDSASVAKYGLHQYSYPAYLLASYPDVHGYLRSIRSDFSYPRHHLDIEMRWNVDRTFNLEDFVYVNAPTVGVEPHANPMTLRDRMLGGFFVEKITHKIQGYNNHTVNYKLSDARLIGNFAALNFPIGRNAQGVASLGTLTWGPTHEEV